MDLIKVFNDLHNLAEPALKEFKTQEYLLKLVDELGFKLRGTIGTGIVCELDSGVDGPVVAMRADMDALTYHVDGEVIYRHCCGHDANMTMAIGTALNIKKQGLKKGKFILVFQPAEETLEGARIVAKSGLVNDVDTMVGVHLRPIAEGKLGEIVPALVHASSYMMKVVIKGVNSHGARPHLGVNAIEVAALFINGINSIKMDPTISYSVKPTIINGGVTTNIIPDKVTLSLDIRSQSNEMMKEIIRQLKLLLEGITKAKDASYEIEYLDGTIAAEYDERLIELAEESIKEEGFKSLGIKLTPGGEDFHFFKEIIGLKTIYIGIGADLLKGLHHFEMEFDKKALENGVKVLTNLIDKIYKEAE